MLVDNFLAQPLPDEVAAGQEFAFFNVVGGDRGEIFNPGGGEVNWTPGQVEARILQNNQFAGIFESVNHVLWEGLSLNFNALLGTTIAAEYQHRATAILVDIEDGLGNLSAEVKSPTGALLWSQNTNLTGGQRKLRFALPNPAPTNVQMINLITTGAAGNFFVASRIAVETTGPDLGPEERFIWTYANFANNYDSDTGYVRDRANHPSGDFDNVSATGGFALASVLAANRGVINNSTAVAIVEKVTPTIVNTPRLHGVLPHFVRGGSNPSIIPGTEWSSLDTVLTYVPILLARQALNLPTAQIEAAIGEMDWDDLILPNGTISHGYDDGGNRLASGWDVFGGETFLAVWAHAAARPQDDLAAVSLPTPPSWNGSGFIDELAAIYLPMPGIDVWGTNWYDFRTQAAAGQVAHYADLPICCASAAEVPEPWAVPAGAEYQAFGVNGRIADNDGTDLIGHRVGAPHYPAMIASLEPVAAAENWDFLKSQGAVSPLNVAESVYVDHDNDENRAVWNPLKGSWNLLLATLGYERALAGEANYLPFRAALANSFVAAGLERLTQPPAPTFVVTDFVPTASGFVAHLNRTPEQALLNLYDVEAGVLGPADVVVEGDTVGFVRGSLVVDAASVTFISTGGPLIGDNYTVTLRSGANGFKDLASGDPLDGNGDGTPGDDYTTVFRPPAVGPLVLFVPDFARGPGQSADVPPVEVIEVPVDDVTPGLPVIISDAEEVVSLSMTIRYDSELLNISGASAGPDARGATVSLNTDTPGVAVLSFSTAQALDTGPAELITLAAEVPYEEPLSAIYGKSHVLDVTDVEINGGAISARADDALHLVAFLGDATGNGKDYPGVNAYSGLDAQRVARVAVGLDSGFQAYPTIDPVIVGDVTGNGVLSGLDAQRIARESVGLDPPEIPPLPQTLRLDETQRTAGGPLRLSDSQLASIVDAAGHGAVIDTTQSDDREFSSYSTDDGRTVSTSRPFQDLPDLRAAVTRELGRARPADDEEGRDLVDTPPTVIQRLPVEDFDEELDDLEAIDVQKEDPLGNRLIDRVFASPGYY